jgi:protein-tyrosine phosphatase
MSGSKETLSVLFVCMGNICRSPTAEGVFRKMLEDRAPHLKVEIDSAGTHAYHVGEPPDHRAVQAAAERGFDLSPIRARRVDAGDFEKFDLVLAMDEDNLRLLVEACPEALRSRIRLFLDFHSNPPGRDVPDPYYGSTHGFEHVLDLVEEASLGLINELEKFGR